jgi:UDP-glucose 4-epimerase
MKILVIGGAGYIGSHCCKLLAKQGIKHAVLDDFSTGFEKNVRWGKLYKGDLGDRTLLRNVFEQENITAVMHFAAFANVGESVTEPAKYYRNNVIKVINLLDQMVESNVLKFIFSSTCATYGVPQQEFIDEVHPQNPINPYGKSKLMVEQILDDYDRAYNLKSICFRYFNAAGASLDGDIGEEHKPETHLIPLVLQTALGQRASISIFGNDYPTPDGTCIRDYIHVDDLSKAHILGLNFLEHRNQSEQFNLGNGEGFSVDEIIKECETITKKQISKTYVERREGDPPRLVGNAKKANSLLGWQPTYTDIKSIISSAWNFHKK